ncbi:hypothetical protein WJX77_004927 [Trebouxia sp. C0004]
MGDDRNGRNTETECTKIARTLVSAREQFDLASRQSAQQAVKANLAKAKQAANFRQEQAGPASSFSPLSAARRCVPPVHLNNTMRGTSRTVLGEDMPLVEPNPSYKSWGYLVCNELAQGVGRQMYYTDEIGETIPLSDSDEEQDSDTESLDGVQREADMFLLSKAVSQFGVRPEVVRIAASMMRAKRATVQTRMQSLAAVVLEGPAIQLEHEKLDVMVAKFTNSFCRRCRIFNCFAHTGPHTKPHQVRPLKPVISSPAACSTNCFKTRISADASLALASATADLSPPQASGNAMGGAVKKEEEPRPDLEADEEDEGLALSSALHLAAPGQAAEQGHSIPTPGNAVESLSVGPLSMAADNSPSTRAPTRAAGNISTAGPEDVQHSSMRSRKWICTATSLQPEMVTAAALAADGAGATAVNDSPDSKLVHPARKRVKHEAAAGQSPTNGGLAVQKTSQLPSRGQYHSNVLSAKDTIVISDSEEEEEQPTATPSSKPTPTPHANATRTHVQTQGGVPTPAPLRTPNGKTTATKSSPEARNTGSASDPIEIDITSEDEDQVPAPAQHQPGSAQDQPGSAPHHLELGQSLLDTTPNRRRSLQGKAPLSNQVKGSADPFSQARKCTPASLQGQPVSEPDALLANVRSAARSSALLSVPRRGRVIFADSSPLRAMAASDDGAGDGAGPSGSQSSHPDAGWTPFEVSVFDKAAEMFSGDSCKMARLVGTQTCQEVYARLQKVGLPAALAGAATLTGPPPQHGRGRWRKANPAKKKMKSTGQAWHVVRKRMKKSKGQDDTAPRPYQPCQCKDDCKEGCPCLNDGHFCEKFCACGPKCGSRFQGCVCKGGCKNKGCPCMAADRECDPDLCVQCQWTICGEKPPGSVDCHNMKLRLRQHKRVAMGLSNVAGWGAFAQEDIRRNEFVAEYTGELINHREADRRGKAYDRDSNTYLFDLNDEWVIDAKHRGNKMRFANHSNEANCRVQIIMVDGDHRVAIFAAKDIPAGTELLYDYGKKFGKV